MDKFCPHPDCDKTIASHHFACPRHWYALSLADRNRIWANYRSGDLDRIDQSYDLAAAAWGVPREALFG